MKGSKTGKHKRTKVYNEGNSTQKQKEKKKILLVSKDFRQFDEASGNEFLKKLF